MHLRGNGQLTLGAGSDDEPPPTPGNVLGDRQGRVPILVAQRFRRTLLSAADSSGVDHHVMGVPLAFDLDLAECHELGLHGPSVAPRARDATRNSWTTRGQAQMADSAGEA